MNKDEEIKRFEGNYKKNGFVVAELENEVVEFVDMLTAMNLHQICKI